MKGQLTLDEIVKLGKKVRWWAEVGGRYAGIYKGIVVEAEFRPSPEPSSTKYRVTATLEHVHLGNYYSFAGLSDYEQIKAFYDYAAAKYKQHPEAHERMHKKHVAAKFRQARRLAK